MNIDTIYSTLNTLFSTVFVGSSIVRQFQNKSMPVDISNGGVQTDYTIELVESEGSDYYFAPDNSGVMTHRGDRIIHVSVEQFNGGALGKIESLKSYFRTFACSDLLAGGGLAFISADNAVQTTRLWNATKYVDSAMLQFRLRTSTEYTETVDIVENGTITGEIDDNITINIEYNGGGA